MREHFATCSGCGNPVKVSDIMSHQCQTISVPVPAPIQDGMKNDANKVRVELLSTVAMEEIAKVMTFGAKKYEAHQWRKGFAWSRLIGATLRHASPRFATLRHVFAWMRGEDKDPESLGQDDRFREVRKP